MDEQDTFFCKIILYPAYPFILPIQIQTISWRIQGQINNNIALATRPIIITFSPGRRGGTFGSRLPALSGSFLNHV